MTTYHSEAVTKAEIILVNKYMKEEVRIRKFMYKLCMSRLL